MKHTLPRSLPRRSHQQGFTLVEIMVALVVVGMLMALFGGATAISTRIDKANMGGAQNQITNLIVPETVARYARRLTLVGIASSDLDVSTSTPWNDTWSIASSTATSATFSYPMDGASDALGADLAAFLTAVSSVSSASYNATTNVLTFTVTL